MFPLQAQDKRAEQGSFGSGHAGGLSLQPQALIQGLQAHYQDAQPSPPGQQEGRNELWPLDCRKRLCFKKLHLQAASSMAGTARVQPVTVTLSTCVQSVHL